ncbi:MAG: type II/IV secretion system ATPase subunit, partial [Candidatus Diapherotrites archaeon]|nr:type II/IV secretion system ATPase subunit [Candidatus Diapherotrites archaeon]
MAKINKSLFKKINKKIAKKLISGAAQRVSKPHKYSNKQYTRSAPMEEKPVVVYRSRSSKKRSNLADDLYKKMTIEKPPKGYWQRTVEQELEEQKVVESVVSDDPIFDEESDKGALADNKSTVSKIDSNVDFGESDFFMPEIIEMDQERTDNAKSGKGQGSHQNPFEHLKENVLFEEESSVGSKEKGKSSDSKNKLNKSNDVGFFQGNKLNLTSANVDSFTGMNTEVDSGNKSDSEKLFIPASSISAPTVPLAGFSDTPKVYQQIDLSQIKAIGRGENDLIRNKMGMKNLPENLHKIPKDLIKKMSSEWEPSDLKKVDEKYALIEPYAYSNIKWIQQMNGLMYYVLEPPLTETEQKTLDRIKRLLIDLLDVNLFELKKEEKIRDYIYNKMDHIIQDYAIFLTKSEYEKMKYYIERDFIGLEIIEPFMRDKEIEDISCIGINLPIYVFHRKYGSIKTNKKFPDSDTLNSYLIKLAQRCGRHISVSDPLLDGSLEDGSRIQATYSSGKEISMKGSTFTIRKFTKDPLTVVDLINTGTIPSMMVAFIWLAL